MKKLISVFALVIACSGMAGAQQRPQYTHYVFNNFVMNPAIAGIESYTEIKAGYRRQWVGLDGAPVTFYTSAHTPIGKRSHVSNSGPRYGSRSKHRRRNNSFSNKGVARGSKTEKNRAHHGVGAIIQADKTGPLSTTGGYTVYAYHVPVAKNLRFSTGLSAGFLQYRFVPRNTNTANSLDPVIAAGNVIETMPDISLGSWVYSDKFFIGVSASQLLNSHRRFVDANSFEAAGLLQKHIYVTSGYKHVQGKWAFLPSAMIKYGPPSPLSVDVNLRAEYDNGISGGVSYRHGDGVAALFGIRITPMLEAAYSYDFTTSGLHKVSAGSHEIMLGFRFQSDNTTLSCPSWLW